MDINPDLLYISSADSVSLYQPIKSGDVLKNRAGKYIDKGQKRHWVVVEIGNKTSKSSVKSIYNKALRADYYTAPVTGFKSIVPTSEFFYVKLKSENDYDKLLSCADKLNCDLCFLS